MSRIYIMLLSCINVNTEIEKEVIIRAIIGTGTIATITTLGLVYKYKRNKQPTIVNTPIDNTELTVNTETNNKNNPYLYLSVSALLFVSIILFYYLYNTNTPIGEILEDKPQDSSPIIDLPSSTTQELDQDIIQDVDPSLTENYKLDEDIFTSWLNSLPLFIHDHPWLSTMGVIVLLLSISIKLTDILMLFIVMLHIITVIFFFSIIILPLLHYFFGASILIYILDVLGFGIFAAIYVVSILDDINKISNFFICYNTVTLFSHFILIPLVIKPLLSYLNTFTLFIILDGCFTFILYCIVCFVTFCIVLCVKDHWHHDKTVSKNLSTSTHD